MPISKTPQKRGKLQKRNYNLKEKDTYCSVNALFGCILLAIGILIVFRISPEINPFKQENKARFLAKIYPDLSNKSFKPSTWNATSRRVNYLRDVDPKETSPYGKAIGNNSHKFKRLKVGFAITITKDGSFQDGAAVLAYSIVTTGMTKDFDCSLIAFVHPNVTSSRPILAKLGYHVIEAPIPINTTAIQFEFLREKINKNGCCGAAELIKLNSYRLTQYDVVVHLDADTFFVNSVGELFEGNMSLTYTTDPNMATFKAPDKMPAQGGFLVLRPSVDDYLGLIHTLMTTEFVIYHGWNRSQIGWFWGGMTVQGILPYYYNRITKPGRSLKVDRCIYNTMADTVDCIKKTLQEVKSAHFTVCQKPWTCTKHHGNKLCGYLHEEWFRLRRRTERYYNITEVDDPCVRKPQAGFTYVPMALEDAVLPSPGDESEANYKSESGKTNKEKGFLPDKSPDTLLPIGYNGFVSDAN